jgi:hypothetical protein
LTLAGLLHARWQILRVADFLEVEVMQDEDSPQGWVLSYGDGSDEENVADEDYVDAHLRLITALLKCGATWWAFRCGRQPRATDLIDLLSHECGSWIPPAIESAKVLPAVAGLIRLIALPHPTVGGCYFVRQGMRVKIGQSANIAKRLKEAATFNPDPMDLVAFEVGDPPKLEREHHARWDRYRQKVGGRRSEWFSIEGALALWLIERNGGRFECGAPCLSRDVGREVGAACHFPVPQQGDRCHIHRNRDG